MIFFASQTRQHSPQSILNSAAGAAVFKPNTFYFVKLFCISLIKKINTRRSHQAAAGVAFD
jgi:hypothetical protein